MLKYIPNVRVLSSHFPVYYAYNLLVLDNDVLTIEVAMRDFCGIAASILSLTLLINVYVLI